MTDFERARRQMVQCQLAPNKITDPELILATGDIPRELFVPKGRSDIAYADVGHRLSPEREMPAAMPFAQLLQLAKIELGDIVLDIACGSGYSTAVLSRIAGSVVAIEDDPHLVELAEKNLAELEIGNAPVVLSDLADGLPTEAPFDVIVIEGSVEEVPATLFDQLKDGGRLVAGLLTPSGPRAALYVRSGRETTLREAFDIQLPRLSAFARPKAFAL